MTIRRGLYLLTRETRDTAALLATVRAAIDGGAVLVQYRDKSNDAASRSAQARALVALGHATGVPILVNDDVSLARECGAAGVHLGRDDVPFDEARRALGPGALIGVSCYDTLERAQDAARHGASYVAFGSFHASPTKPGAVRAVPSLLEAARGLPVPIVAIGGITPENGAALVAAGADLLAVSSAVFDAPDPRAAAFALTSLFHGTRA
ncbi:MAG TPA: thiamine phosphate synthase [Candidatus Saccharimonadia bacterium]|nr:thiamine phosphate synthase [Candidatus Saccharimonadia bacterium]